MKKIFAILLTMAILFSVASCTSTPDKNETESNEETTCLEIVATTEATTSEVLTTNQHSETTTEASTTVAQSTATTSPSTAAQTADYMATYNHYLKNYNGGVYEDTFRFGLIYFNNDDIPELAIAESYAHFSQVKLLTFSDGKVVEMGDFGYYGTLCYVERQSLFVSQDTHQGYTTGVILKVNPDGTTQQQFIHKDNLGAVGEDSDELYFEINGVKVTEEEYDATVEKNMSLETSVFYEGIPMTTANINKYCR